MSALAFLYYVIPFFIAFIIHVLEEILFKCMWMNAHCEQLETRYSHYKGTIYDLSKFSNKAFAVSALEEFIIVLLIIGFIMAGSLNIGLYVWCAIFMAFYFHLLVHVFQAIVVRNYIPGLITSIFIVIATFYITSAIIEAMSMWAFVLITVLGVIFMVANQRFAHWLGAKLFPVKQ